MTTENEEFVDPVTRRYREMLMSILERARQEAFQSWQAES